MAYFENLMSTPVYYLFNKPFQVLCQFTDHQKRSTLAEFISIADIYPCGRLDKDSEGLLILTNDGKLQDRISHPRSKLPKTYWVQVEGIPDDKAIQALSSGVLLKDGMTRHAKVKRLQNINIWQRTPPIRVRKNIPDTWLEITISEGKNRQIRRMTASVGFPTLRLIRMKIGPWSVNDLQPGNLLKLENPWSDLHKSC